MGRRQYTDEELAAWRAVYKHEGDDDRDPAEHGLAQYAGGPYWPRELVKVADGLDVLAGQYRLAAMALDREIHGAKRDAPPAPILEGEHFPEHTDDDGQRVVYQREPGSGNRISVYGSPSFVNDETGEVGIGVNVPSGWPPCRSTTQEGGADAA